MKGLRIGRRRARTQDQSSSPLEVALRPALVDGRWAVPDRFNFALDVVEALAKDPKRQAVTFIGEDGVIEPRTFLDVAEGAAWWAATLAEHGVHAKDRVLVLADSSVHWLEIVLGSMKLGAVTVPCRPSLSAAALEARISSSDATLVVAEQRCQQTIEQMSFTPDVHYIDTTFRRRSSDVPKDSPTHDTSSRDLAFVFTTAGASGAPKEVAHTHGSVFAARVQAEHWLTAGPRDVVWCTAEADSPLQAWFTLAGPWSRGAEIVVHRGAFDPHDRLEQLYRLGPTILCQSPAEYRALANVRRLERYKSPRLRRLVSTGEFLEPDVRQAFEERWELTIHDGYGQAETNVVIASGAEAADVVGAVGHPLPGYELAIIDDQGNELPPGVEGDLALRGSPPTLFAGYWEAPDETKRAFRGDWYVTGDVAMADGEGGFVFVGRAEDVITSSGRTFGPYGIEHVLRAHHAIAASAVVGIRDLQRGGHFVRAFVVPAPGARSSEQLEAELRQHVAEVLPDQHVPRDIVFVDSLPLVGGKVSRATLREQPLSGRPLWDLPPTSEFEAMPSPTPEPAPVRAKAAPLFPPAEAPQPASEPPAAPVPEPAVASEPEPVAIVEPEPVRIVEPEPVAIVEPEPVRIVEPEPVAIVEPEPVAITEPSQVTAPAAPEPAAEETPEPPAPVEPLTVADARPALVPEPEPVAQAPSELEPEPVSRPEFRVLPALEPEPDPGPLPDFVVPPEPEAARPPNVPEPEPEPPLELEPLPEYVVDPSRPLQRIEETERRQAAEADQPAFPGLGRAPEPEPSAADSAGIYFPSVTSFPTPREDDGTGTDGQWDARKTPRRRPAGETATSKRKRSLEEPGDDAGDAGWMAGLSNRLSAYSLAEEGADDVDDLDAEEEDRNAS